MRKLLSVTVGLLLLLTGCLRPPGVLGVRAPLAELGGQVQWGEGLGIQATTTEIAQGATVSLIDPSSGNTVASTLTQANGSFALTFGKWAPAAGQPYLLEAIKGLAIGGAANRAGAPAARIRTLVSKVNGAWSSLTGPTIQITRGTTALCVVASLKGLTAGQQQSLIGALTPNSGPPESYAATLELPAPDFAAVWALVNTALSANQDPLRVIARNVVTGAYTRFERGPVVTDLSGTSGQTGDTLHLYGNGFDGLAGNNQVLFNGIAATGVTVNATCTQLSVTIPDAATTGPLTVKVGNLVMLAAATFTIRGSTVETIAGLNVPVAGRPATEWYLGTPQDVVADSAGNLFAITLHQVMRIAPDGTFTTFAGGATPGFAGDGGLAANAKLNSPSSLALDAADNLYIADQQNHRIRMVPRTSGTYFGQAMTANRLYTIVGNGGAGFAGDGGPATAATLFQPNAVGVDADGHLFIADGYNNRVRMVPRTSGTYFGRAMNANAIYTVVGNGGNAFGGNGVAATSVSCGTTTDVALDAAGNLFLFAPYDEFEGYDDEYGEYYWYTDYSPRIRMVPRTSGTYFGQAMTANCLYTVAGNGGVGFSPDGTAATSALMNQAYGFSLDASGNLLIADSGNHRVRMVPRTAGTHFGQTMAASKIYTLAGMGTAGFAGDGAAASAAKVWSPKGVCTDAAGNVYLADTGNNRVRMVAKSNGTAFGLAVTAHAIYTLAGNGSTTSTFTGDGGPAANAKFDYPNGVVLDAEGNLFVSDRNYQRIRMIPKTSGTYFGQAMTANAVYTVAGSGTAGFAGDGGPATSARLNYATDLALDAAGNLFIADSGNHRVRMVPRTSGTYFGRAMTAAAIYTIAGTGTYSFTGDGGAASSATLHTPVGLAVDAAGHLFIADSGNHRVRMVPRADGTYFGRAMTANSVYTVAGNGSVTFNGNGVAATAAAFAGPTDVALDAAGNLYLATAESSYSDYDEEGYYYTDTYDTPNVRMVPRTAGTYFGQAMAANLLYTVAGNGSYGYAGDGGLATGAQLRGPLQIALDLSGNLYLADKDNHRIRMVPRTGGRRYGRLMAANSIYTIVGTGTPGYNGDGDASVVSLHYPSSVALGASELYIADSSNNLVRKVF